MSAANPQHEPTMEEILASIRKIISEDQPDGAKAAPQPTPVRAAAFEAQQADTDVLELTEEVKDEVEPESPKVQPPIENDIAFETIEPDAKAEPKMDDNELISETARSAMGQAFSKLNGGSSQPTAASNGTLEALFENAVQNAFTPALQAWVDDHQTEIMDGLKPLIREWMDDNLPRLIESAVIKELSRERRR